MHVTINSEPRDIPDGLSVAELLRHLGLPNERIAVERNREVVRRKDYDATPVAEGDVFEIVTFVGGG